MSIRKFGPKGTDLAKLKFTYLLNYLSRDNIKEFKTGETFRKIGKNLKLFTWVEFDLQPTSLSRIYKVLIISIEGYSPHAYILSPSLNELKETKLSIPHLYDSKRFRLCLHYPHTNDYKCNEEIGQQYIPWIKLWLYYFEEWLCSKEWKGGGVEPGDEIDQKFNPNLKSENTIKDNTLYDQVIKESQKIYDRRLKKLEKALEND